MLCRMAIAQLLKTLAMQVPYSAGVGWGGDEHLEVMKLFISFFVDLTCSTVKTAFLMKKMNNF